MRAVFEKIDVFGSSMRVIHEMWFSSDRPSHGQHKHNFISATYYSKRERMTFLMIQLVPYKNNIRRNDVNGRLLQQQVTQMHYAVKLTGEKNSICWWKHDKKVLSRCFFTCFVGFLDEFAHLHSWRQVMKSTRIKNVLSNETCIKWRMLVKLAALQFIRFHS